MSSSASPVTLRDYQKMLVASSASHSHCIVSLPTGAGKTLIAVARIRQVLEAETSKGKVRIRIRMNDLGDACIRVLFPCNSDGSFSRAYEPSSAAAGSRHAQVSYIGVAAYTYCLLLV
jgi:hypothetical protein